MVTLSDTTDTELSETTRAPVKTLPTTSEGTRLTSGNFAAALLTESAIAETSLSDVLRNPVKDLVTLSDITATELSEMERAPVKTLPTTSEGTRLPSGNFPTPLLTESAIETTSDRDFTRPLFTTSAIVDARSSDVVLNPVKTLPTASEGTRLSNDNLPTPMLTGSGMEATTPTDS